MNKRFCGWKSGISHLQAQRRMPAFIRLRSRWRACPEPRILSVKAFAGQNTTTQQEPVPVWDGLLLCCRAKDLPAFEKRFAAGEGRWYNPVTGPETRVPPRPGKGKRRSGAASAGWRGCLFREDPAAKPQKAKEKRNHRTPGGSAEGGT